MAPVKPNVVTVATFRSQKQHGCKTVPATMPLQPLQPSATMTPWLRGCSIYFNRLDGGFCATATMVAIRAQPPQPCLYTVRMVARGRL